MFLFGKANWWFPRWLDRVLPHLSVDPELPSGSGLEPALPAHDGSAPVGATTGNGSAAEERPARLP
jgi:RND superfamily putative drug exporter